MWDKIQKEKIWNFKKKKYKKQDKYINQWLENNWIKIFDENRYIVLRDIEVSSCTFVDGLADSKWGSGWTKFKNINGKTLDDVYRK